MMGSGPLAVPAALIGPSPEVVVPPVPEVGLVGISLVVVPEPDVGGRLVPPVVPVLVPVEAVEVDAVDVDDVELVDVEVAPLAARVASAFSCRGDPPRIN